MEKRKESLERRSQVSFEFIVIFGFLMLLFLIGGTVIVNSLDNTNSAQSQAQYLAKQIKIAVITASLSESDFKTIVDISKYTSGESLVIDIYGDTDNMVIVNRNKGDGTYEQLAREFIPRAYTPSEIKDFSGGSIMIEKMNNQITITTG